MIDIGLAKVTQLDGRWCVSSSTKNPGSALLVENGWVESFDTLPAASDLGASLRRAWTASNELPQLGEETLDRSAASQALGFDDHDALMAAGAKVVIVNLIKGLVRISPTRNEGPGKSFIGLAAPETTPPEDLNDAQLGTLVLQAMERSQ